MTSRPKNLETLILTLELLKRIPRTGRTSTVDLQAKLAAAGLKRDLRTIQRQLDILSERFGIERDTRDKPFGYRWKPNAGGFTIPALSRHESLLLMLAEQQLKTLLPIRVMKSMDGVFAQARRDLSPNGSARLEREWLSKVRVVSATQPLLPPKIQPGVFEAVSDALFENKWLEVEYRNASGKVSPADVMPLGLSQQGPRTYLVCRYKGFDNERSLALNRIQSAKMSTLAFTRPTDFDLKKYDDDGRFGFGDGKRVRITFKIEKNAGLHLLESQLSADQSVRELGDYYVISATVVDSALLDRWLSSFGKQVSAIRKKAAIGKLLDAKKPNRTMKHNPRSVVSEIKNGKNK